MRLALYLPATVLLLLTGAILSCTGENLVEPSTGALEVTTTTSGDPHDPDGYTLQLDSGLPIAIGSAVTFPRLSAGDHVVLLSGFAATCSVVGQNPRTVSVAAGGTTAVSFEVTCAATTGSLEITTATTGESLDPNGFTVSLDGAQPRTTSINTTLAIPNLAPGAHTVAVGDVAGNCAAAEPISQAVTVSPGVAASVRFTITCAFAGAVRWTSIPLPPGVTAETGWGSRSLWGTSPSDLFVAGSATHPNTHWGIWHYDGQGWTEQVSSRDTALIGIWGSSATDVYAIGAPASVDISHPPAILHYDGSRWSPVSGPAYAPAASFISYRGIWGSDAHNLFLSGSLYRSTPPTGLLLHYDGTRWLEMSPPGIGDNPRFTDLAGTSATDVWAVGSRQLCDDCNYSHAIVAHYDGHQWKEVLVVTGWFYGVWATAPNDVWVVGINDESIADVRHFDGNSWSGGRPLSTFDLTVLNDVWGSSPSDVYAVGPGILIHYDGAVWTKIPNIGGDRVWGTSREDVFVLRANEVLHGTP